MSERTNNTLSARDRDALLATLRARFEAHEERHHGLTWRAVQARLEEPASALWSLAQMESSGGEPDVVTTGARAGTLVFMDCSPESPKGRRSVCYDGAALASRKENKPKASALEMAAAMGIKLLTEAQYRDLQAVGEFDTKTSSWVQTPPDIRARGGALFCDRRYGQVFLYHNGADSYYAARGFRGALEI